MMFADKDTFFNNKLWVLFEKKSNNEVVGACVFVDKRDDKYFPPREDMPHAKSMFIGRSRLLSKAQENYP